MSPLVWADLPRRRADQLLQLRLGQRLAEKLEFHRIAKNSRHIVHVVGLQGFLRVEGLDGIANEFDRLVDLLCVEFDGMRVGIHPVDRLAISRHEAGGDFRTFLQQAGIDDGRPHGLPAQPMSIWPDITAVRVAGVLPVGVGFALSPSSSTKASTILWELDPLVEYAIVLRAVASASVLSGESARTYQ